MEVSAMEDVWSDIEQFGLPASFFLDQNNKSNNILAEKLFDMVDHLTKVVQFIPDTKIELMNLKERLVYLEEKNKRAFSDSTYKQIIQTKQDIINVTGKLDHLIERKEMLRLSIFVGVSVLNKSEINA